MSKKQCQMQPHRAATVADGAGAPTPTEAQAYTLTTFGFDGVRFNYTFLCDGEASASLEVWFYDSANQMWIPDASQNKELGEQGSGTFQIETQGRPLVVKIVALSLPVVDPAPSPPFYLLITQGAYTDCKV